MKSIVKSIAIVILTLSYIEVSYAGPYYDFYTGAAYVDNLSLAADSDLAESDSKVNFSGVFGYRHEPKSDLSVEVRAKIDLDQYSDFDSLDNTRYQIDANARQWIAEQTWTRIDIAFSIANYEDNNRDGEGYGLGFAVGRDFSERWRMQLGYRFDGYDAERREYTTENHDLYLDTVYSLTKKLGLYSSVVVGTGDVTTIAPTVNPQEEWVDSTFGNGLSAFLEDADTRSITLGLDVQLSQVIGLYTAYTFAQYGIDGDDIDNNVWTLNLKFQI